eukprot:TRINITY_DN90014_c0_g1_i1.p1 TRINITY_DN90014_c0_g1~~TRINITY_DN90014_c0_g1_i1.p1  ORF type:complete len:246 (+),score=15.74 TRINITY_DN90014_c0_g1_i1:37-774(+)
MDLDAEQVMTKSNRQSIACRWKVSTTQLDRISRFLNHGDTFFNGKDKLLRIFQYALMLSKNANAQLISQAIALGRWSNRFFVMFDIAQQFVHFAEEDLVLWWHGQLKRINDFICFGGEHIFWISTVCPSIGALQWNPAPITRFDGFASLSDRVGRWSSWPWFAWAILEASEAMYKRSQNMTTNKEAFRDLVCAMAEAAVALHYSLLREGRPPLLSRRMVAVCGMVCPLVGIRSAWQKVAKPEAQP